MDQEDLQKYASFAETLADAAGEVLQQYFRKSLTVDNKDDASPVTIADREAEEAMRELIGQRFPGHGIWGEEFGRQEGASELCWVIDPIDGTRSFIAGKPLFGTLIALLESETPVLGLIDQPISRERWVGITGQPTRLNGEPVQTGTCEALEQAVLSTTSPYLFNAQEEAVFRALSERCATTVFGSDCYAYAMLASGHIDLVLESGLKPYDFLALCPVIEGAGGIVTDWQGKPLTMNSAGDVLAASGKALHQQALQFLRDQGM